jgi:hypothetical protein
MEELIIQIGDILGSTRFSLQDEKVMQAEIEAAFKKAGMIYLREHRLSNESIPDFFIDGIAIEIKIKGSAMEIFRQLERYCEFPEVKALILVTNKSMALPNFIKGKPSYLLNPAKAWL